MLLLLDSEPPSGMGHVDRTRGPPFPGHSAGMSEMGEEKELLKLSETFHGKIMIHFSFANILNNRPQKCSV